MAQNRGLSLQELQQMIDALPIEEQNQLSVGGSLAVYNNEKTFTDEQAQKYHQLYHDFLSSYTSNSPTKGACLEKLVRFIFSSCIFFNVRPNIHTSTNEIDVLVELTDIGKQYSQHINLKGDYLLVECKNYKKTVGVTWVGKFCSLVLFQSNTRIGILFSHEGFAGKNNWVSAKGLARKFHCYKENDSEKLLVLDFNKADFKRLDEGECFLDIFHQKIQDLECDIDITKYLQRHPAQPVPTE